MNFTDLMLGKFTVSDHSIRLSDIAKQYHERCDAFDKKVCGGVCKVTGDPVPANHWELGRINKHAHEVKRAIYLDNADIDPREIRKAISKYRA